MNRPIGDLVRHVHGQGDIDGSAGSGSCCVVGSDQREAGLTDAGPLVSSASHRTGQCRWRDGTCPAARSARRVELVAAAHVGHDLGFRPDGIIEVRQRGFAAFSAYECDVSGHRNDREPSLGSGSSSWAAGGLVVAGGVEGQFAEEFAGGGVDDADVQVLDEQQDVGPGVGPADADVVELAVGGAG